MRISDGYIPMQAGPEIGVASTKAFTNSIMDLYLLACLLAEFAGHSRQRINYASLWTMPLISPIWPVKSWIAIIEYQELANHFFKASDFLYLGRGINYPIALEGALKLKEISYIHAEGYPAGEMKHGPIALIDDVMPVVAIVTKDDLYEKMVSQVQQAKARGGVVIALATEGDEAIRHEADYVIYRAADAAIARAHHQRHPSAAAELPYRRPARRRR